ncbi:MAG: rubredoxin [Bacteroidota bacterium]|nr:rubredoxin [Bacteroidota bacterium]
MKHNHVIKLNALGGITTPLKLKSMVEMAFKADVKHINLGPRQEIFFNVHRENLEEFVSIINESNIDFELDADHHPNIVSSYPAEGIFSNDIWLTEGIYKDIFDLFDFAPKLKISICDIGQSLVPLFQSQLNFISSPTYQYWYLYINFEESENFVRWDRLIYTTDIPKICREIEELYLNNKIQDSKQLMDLINTNTTYLFEEIHKELSIPRYSFPYYEGMNKYGDKFWLGIYRRDYLLPIPFIHELCALCINLNIGQLCITPWRTFIIKGINQSDRIHFEKLLGKHGINLRHSITDLNWIVEDINSDELELKQYFISAIDKIDARTFGLVFGLNLNKNKSIPASIIIQRTPVIKLGNFSFFFKYNIFYSENFNPNSLQKTAFAMKLDLWQVPKKLIELCKLYYSKLNEIELVVVKDEIKTPPLKTNFMVYQCQHCQSVYDSRIGDSFNNIPPDISFEKLPDTFVCSVCESPKSDFVAINADSLVLN